MWVLIFASLAAAECWDNPPAIRVLRLSEQLYSGITAEEIAKILEGHVTAQKQIVGGIGIKTVTVRKTKSPKGENLEVTVYFFPENVQLQQIEEQFGKATVIAMGKFARLSFVSKNSVQISAQLYAPYLGPTHSVQWVNLRFLS